MVTLPSSCRRNCRRPAAMSQFWVAAIAARWKRALRWIPWASSPACRSGTGQFLFHSSLMYFLMQSFFRCNEDERTVIVQVCSSRTINTNTFQVAANWRRSPRDCKRPPNCLKWNGRRWVEWNVWEEYLPHLDTQIYTVNILYYNILWKYVKI